MTPFEFVGVFFSVVIGLGVTHLLSALSDVLEIRRRVRFYWVQSVWLVVVLLLLVQGWWGMWDLQSAPRWTYPAFLLQIGKLICLYLLSTLVLPRAAEGAGELDLAGHYYDMRAIFFTLLTLNMVLALVVNVTLFDAALLSGAALIPAAGGILAAVAALTSSRAYHGFVTLFFLAGTIAFVILDRTTIG
jgi:hypothetical protein